MILDTLIPWAHAQGASDLHLEPGLPAAVRIRGSLRTTEEPVAAATLHAAAQELVGVGQWPAFAARRSFDLSRNIRGIRCRINILHSSRGIGLAVRLLASFQVTLEKLNLHPDLRRFLTPSSGLLIVTGPTG
ncbi:MAG TPA: hypothetical protein VHH73_04225, partial [Verrucomicrobiae bacterium]|nr:hypothetical protein [Verrucomicrobiae bacterium]